MLGKAENSRVFSTLEKILELERVKSEKLYLDECTEKQLMAALRASDLFLITPDHLNKGCRNSAENGSDCFFEIISTGYAMANKGRLLIFSTRPSELNDLFYGEPVVSTIGEAISFFRCEMKTYESNKIFMEARELISEAHLSFSSTGLVQAVEYGMYRETEAFLKAGFPTETENKNGVPLLSLAVRNGDMEICRLLMSYEASVNVIARDRRSSPLIDALGVEKKDIVRLLIDAGADLNFKNRNGQTALIVAIGSRASDIADLLIESGADMSVKDSLGMNAASYAKLFSMIELYEKLGVVENND
jgi:ankyrin repeat protein